MSQILRFHPGGSIACLYTEAIDLRALGRLQVFRSTGILPVCRFKLPPELEHKITHVDFSLPDVSQLGTVLEGIVKSAKLKNMNQVVRESSLRLDTMDNPRSAMRLVVVPQSTLRSLPQSVQYSECDRGGHA